MSRTVDLPATPKPSPRTAPGWRQLIPLPYGHVGRAARDPRAFLYDAYRHFGDVFRYRVGPFVFHLLSHPDHVRHVLQDHYKNYPRSRLYRYTRIVAGNGLVGTEGDVWRRQRRMVQPAFSHARVAALGDRMTAAATQMLDQWEAGGEVGSGKPIDVAGQMIRLTLRIVGSTLLGVDLGGQADEISPAVKECLSYLDHRLNHLLTPPTFVPTPRNLRFRRARRTMDRVVYGIIAERRRHGATGDDLLSLMMNARDEEGGGAAMTELELRDQVMTFIGAGHETTAVALAWVWYLLSQHADVEQAVRAEVAEVLGGRLPTAGDVPNLKRTRRVIEEALRLYPPVIGVARDVVAEDEIGGFRIPRGSTVLLSQYVTHRHPAAWPDPERFDPDRFLPDRVAARPKFAWFPFLGGPHQCIGQDFAMMEAALIVATVTQRVRLSLAPGTHVEPAPVLSLRPNALPMTASPA